MRIVPGRPARARRPFITGDVRDCKQRAPVVGRAIEHAGRNVRVRPANAIRIVRHPPRRLARELIEPAGAVETERLNGFVRPAPAQVDRHRAIRQRGRQLADERNGASRKGRERARLKIIAHRADDGPPCLWPELRMPRSSPFSDRNVSASSMSSVGCCISTTRKMAEAVAFAVGSGRMTNRESTSSNVVLPQPFSGEVIASRGEIPKASSK